MNIDAVNNSWVQNVVIQNASSVGLLIDVAAPVGGADSGTYQGITIQYTSSACCSASTIGIELAGLDDGTLVRGLDDLNISGCGLTVVPRFGIYVDQSSTRIVNANIQCFQTGIQIGCSSADPNSSCTTSTPTHDVQADNVYYHCTNGAHCPSSVGVAINPSASGDGAAANVTLTNISGTDSTGLNVTNLVKDSDITGFGARTFEGDIFIGDASLCTGCLVVVSSDPGVPWQVPGNIVP